MLPLARCKPGKSDALPSSSAGTRQHQDGFRLAPSVALQCRRPTQMKRSQLGVFIATSVCLALALRLAAEDRPRVIKFRPNPATINVDAVPTAVVVIDMQNDFCSE